MDSTKINFELQEKALLHQKRQSFLDRKNGSSQKKEIEDYFEKILSTPKKINKNRSTSSGSGATMLCHLEERISQLFGLELIYGNFKEMIFSDLRLKTKKIKNSPNLDSGLKKMRIDNLYSPLEALSKVLCNVQDSVKTRDYLHWMFYLPFTVRNILDNYEYESYAELKREKRRIGRLASKLVQFGIFKTDHIHNPKWKLKPNKKQRDTIIFYNPRHHNDEDILNHVIHYYALLAKTLGYPKDKETPIAKAEKKVLTKALKQSKQTEFDISPVGDLIHTAVSTNKKRKVLKEKAIKLQVLRVGKDNQINLVKDRIAKVDNEMLEMKNFGILDSPKEPILIEEPEKQKLQTMIEIKPIPDLEYGYDKTLKMVDSLIGGPSDFVNLKFLLPLLKKRGHNMEMVNQVIKDQLASGIYSQPKPNILCKKDE